MKLALLILATVLLLASAAAFIIAILVVRRFRHRRVWCAYCGFDRSAFSTDVCTECGRADMPAGRAAISAAARFAVAIAIACAGTLAGATAMQPRRVVGLLPDRWLSAIAPLESPPRDLDPLAVALLETLHQRLVWRMQSQSPLMDLEEQGAVVARIAADASRDGLLVSVTGYDETSVELTVTMPTHVMTQRPVALTLQDHSARVCATYLPWRVERLQIQIERGAPPRNQLVIRMGREMLQHEMTLAVHIWDDEATVDWPGAVVVPTLSDRCLRAWEGSFQVMVDQQPPRVVWTR